MNRLINKIYRIFRRNTGSLLINLAGLSVGLAVTIILFVFVVNELSYDRHFKYRERIIRLNSIWIEEGNKSIMPICLRDAYTDLPGKIPGIEKTVQIYRGWEIEIVKDKERFPGVELLYADPQFFDVFPFEFVNGSSRGFTGQPGVAVITTNTAQKIFGTIDVTGKNFSINEMVFTIAGVVKPLPENTHFSFDVLGSMESVPNLENMGGLEFFTYFLLKPGISQSATSEAINRQYAGILKENFSEWNSEFGAATEKITDIYLHSKADFDIGKRGSMQSVYILTGLALLILLLAITNFINLFIVQGDKRAFEVGIRKTNGGTIRNIAIQFFEEASAIVLTAFFLGVFLAAIFIRPFSQLIGKSVEISLLFSPVFFFSLIPLIILTIFLSASYPAFYLSRFRPYEVLRHAKMPSKRRLTKYIVVFQTVITIVLITTILIVRKQIDYLQMVPKGYDDSQVMIINGLNEKLTGHYDFLKQDLLKINGVEAVSAAHHVVGGGTSGQGVRFYNSSDEVVKTINEYRVLPGLCELMKFELAEGKFFGDNADINNKSVILNQSAVSMLGLGENAIGTKLVMFDEPLEVIGVVKDFYYDSPSQKVEPIALTAYIKLPHVIYVRFTPSINKGKSSSLILPVLHQYDPDFILNPVWADDIYSAKFSREKAISKIITAGTTLSLFIALLGLFAIHTYTANRRTKEIGIRKINGGSPSAISILLSAEIIKVILVSGVIAVPLAWLIASKWLGNYANKVHTGILIFLIPVVMQLVFALLATIWVTIRISIRNPVDSLRYE